MADETTTATETTTSESAADAAQAPPQAGEVSAVDSEAEAAPPPAAERVSPKLSALFRTQQKTRAEQQRVKQLAREVATQREELQAQRANVERLQSLAKSDPWAFFQETGMQPEQLAAQLRDLGDPNVQRIAKVERELAEQKAALDKKEREMAEREQRARASHAETRVKSEFSSFVNSAVDYPELSSYEPDEIGQAFWQVASAHFERTGEPPTFEDAAAFLEAQLAEKARIREQRRAAKLGLRTAEKTRTGAEQPKAGGPRSLTNGLATQTASNGRAMSAEDRRKAAIALLEASEGSRRAS